MSQPYTLNGKTDKEIEAMIIFITAEVLKIIESRYEPAEIIAKGLAQMGMWIALGIFGTKWLFESGVIG